MLDSPLVRLVWMLIGCGLVYAAVVQHQKRAFFHKYGQPAQGRVIRLERDADPDSNIQFPIIQFTTRQHETVEVRLDAGTSPSIFHVGQAIRVSYNPLAPKEFVLAARALDWLVYGLGAGGLALLGLGVYKSLG